MLIKPMIIKKKQIGKLASFEAVTQEFNTLIKDINTSIGEVTKQIKEITGLEDIIRRVDDIAKKADWYVGSGIPSTSIGKDGDFYLDKLTKNIYLKENGTWL